MGCDSKVVRVARTRSFQEGILNTCLPPEARSPLTTCQMDTELDRQILGGSSHPDCNARMQSGQLILDRFRLTGQEAHTESADLQKWCGF